MKKILLSVAAVFAAMSVNAQEIAVIDADAIGIGDDAVELAAGTELMKTESVTCSILFTDIFKATGLSENNVTVNDVDFGSTTGIQGSTNPPAAATEGTYPEQGCIYSFVPSKDGFLYVIHKASANKNYVVWENKLRVPYIFSAADGGAYDLNTIEGATVTVDGITNIADEYVIAKAQEIIGTEGLGAGTCVIKVQVFKDCQYDVHATGSKMTMAGFIFDETGDATIKAGDVTLLDKGQIPGAEPAPAAPVYSVIGTLNGNWDNDTDMELVNGVYSTTIDIEAAGSYEWKIRQDHDWTINWGDAGDGTGVQDGPNFIAEMPANSSITITFDPATAKIDAYVAGGALPEPGGDVDIWVSDGSKGAISWSSDYRFASDEKKTGEEIYAVPMDVWEKMKTTPFFLDLEGENPQIRVTTGWWDSDATYTGNDITPGSELLTDNGDGKWTLKVDLSATQALLDLVDDHHLLFTGDRYTPVKLYFSDTTAIKTVKAAKKFNGAIYNLAGQKVNASYKGVVIKDGKKYIQK